MHHSTFVEGLIQLALNASLQAFTLYRIIRDDQGGFQDLEILYASPAAVQIAGAASNESLVGKRLFELFPAHRGTAVWEDYRGVADTGEPMSREAYYHGEGVDCWFETTAFRVDDSHLAISGTNRTERRRSQEKLRVAERTLAAVISVTADAIIFVDPDQRITLFNQSAERIFGYSAAEVLGKHFDFLRPERFRAGPGQQRRGDAAEATVGRDLGDHQAIVGMRKNGEEFPAEASIAKVEGGETPTFVLTLRDISAKLRGEEVMARQAQLIACSNRGVSCVSKEGIILDWNPASEQITGFSAAEVVGTSIFSLLAPTVPPKEHATIRAIYEKLGRGEEVAPQEMVRRRKDGSLYDSLMTRFAIRDASGAVIAIANILQDITERKRLERHQALLTTASSSLGESIDYEQTLATLARLCIPSFADLAVICLMSGAVVRYVAFHTDPRKQASAQQILDLPDFQTVEHSPLGEILRTGKPVLHASLTLEQHAQHRGRSPLYELILQHGVRSRLCVPMVLRGKTHGALCLAYTDSGRAYCAADVPVAEEIAHRGALAMENARLYKEAQDAIHARDNLLAFVSHDLGNLLHPIQLMVDLMRRRTPGPEGRSSKFLETIDRSSTQMKFLVADLLSLANLQAGTLTIKVMPVDAATLLSDVLAAVESLAATKQVHLEQHLADTVQQIVCDPQRIFQVLFNLVNNAIQYVPRHGHIELRLDRVDGAARFAVRDDGCGIPVHRLPELFKRFSKGEAGHNGLGLYMAKSLVEAHGGTIWVESKVGQGSTFLFSVPQPG